MKILIADGDAVNRKILATFLRKWGHEVEAAVDGKEAWRMLQQDNAPRFAILDWMMPGMDGAQLCRVVRQKQSSRYTYLVLLTAKFQKSEVIEGLEAGADDYVTKPFDGQELRARLHSGIRILELEDACAHAREQLEIRATHDGLTGLWNRVATMELLDKELARAHREALPLAVILADLDHFKAVNDTWGHLSGDQVLKEAAERMKRTVRNYDTVGRFGGEEFLILMPHRYPSQAMELAERVRLAVAHRPVCSTAGEIPITISMGVVVTLGDPAVSAESLLEAADKALYRAKAEGRNRAVSSPQNSLPLAV